MKVQSSQEEFLYKQNPRKNYYFLVESSCQNLGDKE